MTSVQPTGLSPGWRAAVGAAAGLLILGAAVALWVPGLGGADAVTKFLLAVAVILLASHVCGELVRKIGQPPVLGEILGGLLLGPSVLGAVWPQAVGWLFPPDVLAALDKAAQLGLVVFMFLLGCELRTDRLKLPRVIGATVVGGMGLPFLCGVGVALLAGPMLAGTRGEEWAFYLFFGLAVAVTALPVLARILVDLGIEQTRVGVLALSSAAIGDGAAWLVLTLILAAGSAGGFGQVPETAGLAAALLLVTVLCVRPALAALAARTDSARVLTIVLVVGATGFSALTQLINLHPLIGAFLFGVAVPRGSEAVRRVGEQLQGFTLMILLPLFFAGVGLKTSIGLIGAHPWYWMAALGILVVAQVSKVVGAGGAALLAGLPRRESLQLGVLMNCRGVTELVIAAIGLQFGLINQLGFTILVLLAIITTAMTVYLVRYTGGRPLS
uniref:cation:proton antiporter n=1 Tax=Herbidospora sakaeratensis TaxID=564415 RepID=UPI00078432D2|nr:cation:proton antiporter [Herbidospora sakaeratensis]